MSKPEKFIPLSEPNFKGRELRYLKECLKTNWVAEGRFLKEFENRVRQHLKAGFSISCINGTSGLFISLKLLGVNASHEVIAPALTFIAPINAINYLGAKPVFMDCDKYMNLDPVKLEEFWRKECNLTSGGLKNKRTGRIIKAVVVVHIFGNPADLESIMKVAKNYRLKVVEDAAESVGAFYTKGIYKGCFTGTIAELGVLSFNGNKIVTSGSGGMILTSSSGFAKKAVYLINQAKDDPVRYIHKEVGYNFRLSNVQAALGLAQFERLDAHIAAKKANYEFYKSLLSQVPGIQMSAVPEGTRPNYWFYSLIIDRHLFGMGPDVLMKTLNQRGIQSRPLWFLNHLQKPYANCQSYKIENAEWFLKRVLNIPCSVGLTRDSIRQVVLAIKKARN